MTDHIPFEIQSEIMRRLPVKSLLRFRSVSNSCKSLIDSSHFIKHYIGPQQHLLVKYLDVDSFIKKYVSIVDDDDRTFPVQDLSPILPPYVYILDNLSIIGSFHGLLCLYDSNHNTNAMNLAVLWNPSIRKAVGVVVPETEDNNEDRTVLGFGVCPETNDPKIVKITHSNDLWQVEVFTLSTGAWRSPHGSIFPRSNSIFIRWDQVVLDGCVYWLATDDTSEISRDSYHLIISFDITSEEFKEVSLPDALATCNHENYLTISKLMNSLVVLERNEGEMLYNVWMMEDGVSKLFIKIFTICRLDDVAILRPFVLEFRKSGEPVIRVDRIPGRSLVVYEPNSKRINNLGVNAGCFFDVTTYMETLLLLDQPDNFIYENKKV
ncbi:putative F-box domain-containing protein [Helianthus annuus]|nr:putative F-box domain-containing protein [Helianthus annuus]KAJ0555436.1 putative F-box domain-containing protein [Helianthus annuus]KAJ0790864.1 putative F-box domain-containing protein [Helianthus annuus]